MAKVIHLESDARALLCSLVRAGGRSVCFAVADVVPMAYERLAALDLVTRHRASIGEVDEHISYAVTQSGRAAAEQVEVSHG